MFCRPRLPYRKERQAAGTVRGAGSRATSEQLDAVDYVLRTSKDDEE